MQSSEITATRTQLARRHDILLAAIKVMNRDGYSMASIERIAKEASTTKSTVLYHFKSKEAIYKALVGSILEDGAAYMTPYLIAAKTYQEKLHAYITSNLEYVAKHAARIAALHQIEKNTARKEFEDSSSWMEDDRPVQWLRQMLIDGQQKGEFGEFDAHVMALVIRSTIDSASLYFATHPSIDTTLYIHEIVQLFERTVKPT